MQNISFGRPVVAGSIKFTTPTTKRRAGGGRKSVFLDTLRNLPAGEIMPLNAPEGEDFEAYVKSIRPRVYAKNKESKNFILGYKPGTHIDRSTNTIYIGRSEDIDKCFEVSDDE
jgi:hypothetical protein